MLKLNIKNVYFNKGNKLSHTDKIFTEVNIQISQTEISYFTQPTIFNNVEVILVPRGEVWAHKTSLTSPFFVIEVSVPGQESGRWCLCVWGIDFCLCVFDYSIWFWNCSDGVVFVSLFFILFISIRFYFQTIQQQNVLSSN